MIDGGVFLGRDPTVEIGMETGELLDRLRRCGAVKALALSFRGVHFDWREGNAETLDVAARHPDVILPMATVNMLAFDVGAGLMTDFKQAGFKALALFAHPQGWSYGDYVFKAALGEASRASLPVQVGLKTREDLAKVAANAGNATVLVRWMRGSGYNTLPDVLAVARDCPQFVFDVGTISQSGGLERLVERVGADRLYLASNMPLALERAAYFMLRAARLSDADRRAIESGTLARILGIPPLPAAREPEDWARFKAWPKLDTHWHTSGWNIIEPRIGFDDLMVEFDTYNYRAVVNSSIRALNDDLVAGNAETLAFMQRDARVRGLVVINPLQPEKSIAELNKYRHNANFVGVKTIQDFYSMRLDDPAYFHIFDFVRDRMPGWPVMAHLPGMKEAAEAYPTVQFIAAHSTWNYKPLAPLKNVYFDIATSTPLRREADIADLCKTVGADRVIFSSDGQLMNPAWTLGKLASAGLPDATLAAIFERNALSAFPRLKASLPSGGASGS